MMTFSPSRREILRTMGTGFGMAGLAGILQAERPSAVHEVPLAPLAPKSPHFTPTAKHVIFLFLNGGPSQVDTFDPKPMLQKYGGHPIPSGNLKTERKTGNLLGSPFAFRRCGKSGIEISEIFPKLGDSIDDVCVIRSMYTEIPNHEPSLFLMNCGHRVPGRPSMGSWLTYGLGSENQNLPGYVVLCPGYPIVGAQLWSATFLPAIYQGTYIPNSEKTPDKLISYIRNPSTPLPEQRRALDLLRELNVIQEKRYGEDGQLESSIQAAEIAYRMQSEAPEVFDITREPEAIRGRYGDHDFGRGCLMARRLVERGVRMVQVYYGNGQPWDNHDDILIHRKLAHDVDGPSAALLADLKASGLLKETVVIIGGEFGRTPVLEVSGLVKVQNGHDHNSHGFSTLLAGGGFKGGITYGNFVFNDSATTENPVHIHDLHATVLHALGMDHTKLTYRYSGRDFRLTDVAGNVVHDILA